MKTCATIEVQLHFGSRHSWAVSFTPRLLYCEERGPGTQWTGSWMSPSPWRSGETETSWTCRKWNLVSLDVQPVAQSLYRQSYHGSHFNRTIIVFNVAADVYNEGRDWKGTDYDRVWHLAETSDLRRTRFRNHFFGWSVQTIKVSRKMGFPNPLFVSYLLTYLRSWALLHKLPIVQPLKNIPAFCGIRRFITVFTRNFQWSISSARSIQPIPYHSILSL
jgi:hypothetical protein